ncbi:Uncharacterised protein [Enterococcus casseliflavus]|uniref:Uncharacterized protein n=1 Tax=Enterococcus casseliflavus TaxID=37734 RepID=A0A6N3EM72_ENTCA
MKKTLLASASILALSAIGFTNTVHATEGPTKTVNVEEGEESRSLTLTNPDVTSVDFNFEEIIFVLDQPNGTLDPQEFSITYDIQNKTFTDINGERFTIDVSTEGSGLTADFVNPDDSKISETKSGTRNTGNVIIEATLDPTLFDVSASDSYKIIVSLNDSTPVAP